MKMLGKKLLLQINIRYSKLWKIKQAEMTDSELEPS